MTLVERFVDQVQSQPQAVALRTRSSDGAVLSYTWKDLGDRVCVCRSVLERYLATGIQAGPGPHVATYLPNGLAWIVIDLAVQSLGWVHVAIDRRLPAHLALQLVRHSHSQLLVTSDLEEDWGSGFEVMNSAPLIAGGDVDCSFDSWTQSKQSAQTPAQILYTSGTMSHPRGVVLSQNNLFTNALAKLEAAPQMAADVRINVLPFAHAYARTCELSTWIITGGQLCIANDWNSLLDWAIELQPTLLNVVPHLANKLAQRVVQQSGDGASVLGPRLRLLQVGGAALPRSTWETLAGAGWPPLQGYGLTETSPVVCSNRAGQQLPDSVGWPVPGVEVKVDQQGVLWTKGPHVMLGYWDDPLATAERIQEGWFCTGDLATIYADGRVTIRGRMDDQIALSTGYNVSPLELSQLLSEDPWVESIVIVGQGRPYLAALVAPDWSAIPSSFREDQAALQASLVERWRVQCHRLPRWMQIQRVGFLPEPLSIEGGGLNFKGAVRRKYIEEQLHAELVANLYSDDHMLR